MLATSEGGFRQRFECKLATRCTVVGLSGCQSEWSLTTCFCTLVCLLSFCRRDVNAHGMFLAAPPDEEQARHMTTITSYNE